MSPAAMAEFGKVTRGRPTKVDEWLKNLNEHDIRRYIFASMGIQVDSNDEDTGSPRYVALITSQV